MNCFLCATAALDAVDVGNLSGWQAVAVALINMVGAVVMAAFREKTNRVRERKNGLGHSGSVLPVLAPSEPLGTKTALPAKKANTRDPRAKEP